MPETNETSGLNLGVTRNGITKQLSKSVFGAKSDNKGKEFYYPEITVPTLEEDIKWLGIDEVATTLDKVYRRIFADIYLDNVDETTGQLNTEQMQSDWADFTAGVAKLSDIDDQLDTLQAEQQKYALDPEYQFGEMNEDGTPTEQAAKTAELIKQVNLKIKPLRAQKASIEAKYAERAAKRKAKKEAAEAAKAKGSPVTA